MARAGPAPVRDPQPRDAPRDRLQHRRDRPRLPPGRRRQRHQRPDDGVARQLRRHRRRHPLRRQALHQRRRDLHLGPTARLDRARPRVAGRRGRLPARRDGGTVGLPLDHRAEGELPDPGRRHNQPGLRPQRGRGDHHGVLGHAGRHHGHAHQPRLELPRLRRPHHLRVLVRVHRRPQRRHHPGHRPPHHRRHHRVRVRARGQPLRLPAHLRRVDRRRVPGQRHARALRPAALPQLHLPPDRLAGPRLLRRVGADGRERGRPQRARRAGLHDAPLRHRAPRHHRQRHPGRRRPGGLGHRLDRAVRRRHQDQAALVQPPGDEQPAGIEDLGLPARRQPQERAAARGLRDPARARRGQRHLPALPRLLGRDPAATTSARRGGPTGGSSSTGRTTSTSATRWSSRWRR